MPGCESSGEGKAGRERSRKNKSVPFFDASIAIDLAFPTPSSKAAAVRRIGEKVSKETLASLEAKYGADLLLQGGAKGTQKLPELGGVDAFLGSQAANLNKKLGAKIGEGRLPYEASRAGVEQAKLTVKETLENATAVSELITKSAVRGGHDLIHVYSSKTNSTVSLRALPGGKYEFDTLIPEKSSKF